MGVCINAVCLQTYIGGKISPLNRRLVLAVIRVKTVLVVIVVVVGTVLLVGVGTVAEVEGVVAVEDEGRRLRRSRSLRVLKHL